MLNGFFLLLSVVSRFQYFKADASRKRCRTAVTSSFLDASRVMTSCLTRGDTTEGVRVESRPQPGLGFELPRPDEGMRLIASF